jgi:hypothetical protein
MGTFREERRGPVEVWTLDAEDTRNAISRAVLAELDSRVARVSGVRRSGSSSSPAPGRRPSAPAPTSRSAPP